jgi:membrane protein required for beta-lactamase induction
MGGNNLAVIHVYQHAGHCRRPNIEGNAEQSPVVSPGSSAMTVLSRITAVIRWLPRGNLGQSSHYIAIGDRLNAVNGAFKHFLEGIAIFQCRVLGDEHRLAQERLAVVGRDGGYASLFACRS